MLRYTYIASVLSCSVRDECVNEYAAFLKWYWYVSADAVGERTVSLPLCLPQIPHKPETAARGLWSTAWTVALPDFMNILCQLHRIFITEERTSWSNLCLFWLMFEKSTNPVLVGAPSILTGGVWWFLPSCPGRFQYSVVEDTTCRSLYIHNSPLTHHLAL